MCLCGLDCCLGDPNRGKNSGEANIATTEKTTQTTTNTARTEKDKGGDLTGPDLNSVFPLLFLCFLF